VSGFAAAKPARRNRRRCAGLSRPVRYRRVGIARAVLGAAGGGNSGGAAVRRTVAGRCAPAGGVESKSDVGEEAAERTCGLIHE
ncbi:tRNA 5-methylaminomethyl-2-thiouridine biosynthesis MnmC, partial [Serratia marcescens]